MIRTILTFCILLALSLATAAQTGTITNISVQPSTDGSGMVDVYFNLSGSAHAYNINLEVSFDGGSNWHPIPTTHLSGDIAGISPGNNKHLVWDGFASFPNEYSTQTRLKIIAAAQWIAGEGVTDIDGNFYPSVIIGNQEWMAENLRVTRDANGNNITRYCFDDNAANCDLYGGLYDWWTMMNNNYSNTQGICPTGWHIPNHYQWTELEQYICNQLGNWNCETIFPYDNSTEGWLGLNEGNALKSCRQVSSPLGGDCATSEHPRWNSSHTGSYGTDEFGFSALPGGNHPSSSFMFGYEGFWWSSSTKYYDDYYDVWYRSLHSYAGEVERNFNHPIMRLSVRCVKGSVDDCPIDNDTEVVDVINPVTGKTWMDRNLGASRAATSSTDAEAYGDLYQWGRAADGHQKRTSGTTTALSNIDTPGHDSFILVADSPWDWRRSQNDNFWQGVNGSNNPCPEGYRLPTESELNGEWSSWSSNNAAGAFASPLKLPVAGNRNRSDGSLLGVGSNGIYWTSTVRNVQSRYVYFTSSTAGVYSAPRARGFSVRCIKN